MTRLLAANRRTTLIACGFLLSCSVVAVALGIQSSHQRAQGPAQDDALKQVNAAPDQFLRIVGNDDCPLRIVEARVKDVPAPLFTTLTGKTTDLATVSTLPDVTLVNTSGRTITGFFLVVRDPNSRKLRGILQRELKIQPGETYVVKRDLFIAPDKVTVADARGHIEQRLIHPGLSSEKGWVEFAARSDLFVTVGAVNFEDKQSWQIKEGGEVK